MAGLDRLVVGDDPNGQRAAMGQQLGEAAIMVGTAMLHDHEGHADIGGHRREKRFERFEPTRRRTNPHHGTGSRPRR
jgi:hypothetical protein